MFYDDQEEILNDQLLAEIEEDEDEDKNLYNDKKEDDDFNPRKIDEPEELDNFGREFSDGNY